MMESVQRVARVVKDEEHRYATTFLVAEKSVQRRVEGARRTHAFPGAVSFKLYDTYGLALDEQEDMARERGLAIDREGFETRDGAAARARPRQLEGRREGRGRAGLSGAAGAGPHEVPRLQRAGGDVARDRPAGRIASWWTRSPPARRPSWCSTRRRSTPRPAARWAIAARCYSAAGEKVADVETAYPPVPGPDRASHRGRRADPRRRRCCAPKSPRRCAMPRMRNHTATHLLHAALRQVLGTHVKQAGSVVEPGAAALRLHALRRDGSRPRSRKWSGSMNEQILQQHRRSRPTSCRSTRPSPPAPWRCSARSTASRCGWFRSPASAGNCAAARTCARTGDIGVCKIVYEGSISAGVRRIEAITGEAALRQYQETTGALQRIAEMVRAAEPELVEHVEKLLATEHALEKQVEQLKSKLAQAAAGELEGRRAQRERRRRCWRRASKAWTGSRCARWPIRCATSGSPRWWCWRRRRMAHVSIVSAVTKDLTAKVHAGKLVGAVAQAVGGKGGGRPDMAEGGGKDAAALDAALWKRLPRGGEQAVT